MKTRKRERKQVTVVDQKPALPPSQFRHLALLSAVLAAATLVAYYPVLSCGFVSDDDLYVTQNAGVQAGLSPIAIAWALCANVAANWHPVTLLSLQLDSSLFGLEAWGYHLHNLLLHVANVLLLFHVLRRMTGAVWRSFVVAGLFALHPLHVESVAWVSERKDLLSTLFGLFALWAYLRYVARPDAWRMTAVAVLLALSLLAKPMWVTFPCLLLLLDYWPLGRWTAGPRRLFIEKIPLFVLVVLMSVIAVLAQGAAVETLDNLPLPSRVANAAVSYVAYLRQTFVPTGLAIFYPHPGADPQAGIPFMLILVVSVMAVWAVRRNPYVFVGWFWYLGMLVPVIGLVQVGVQARADRYTYVPLIGIFVALTWSCGDLLARAGQSRLGLALAALLIAGCGVLTWFQLGHWRDEVTLWEQSLRVAPDNSRALTNLGLAFRDLGRSAEDPSQRAANYGEALARFDRIARLYPNDPGNHTNRGTTLLEMGRLDDAETAYKKALAIDPRVTRAQRGLNNIATLRQRLGQPND